MNGLYFVKGFGVMLACFVMMEGVAWSLHKFVMHGFLWYLHDDHHNKTRGFFEKNDFFFLFFAVPSALLMYFGIVNGCDMRMWVGIGITLYGIAYFFVHEIIIHKRLKIPIPFKNSTYIKGLQLGHKAHHKHLDRFEGECFGMLLVPKKYFEQARKLNAS